ncbi:MAG: alpha/beta hydrolase [Saprospiraceae bacterium]|nr:alpha/beta hydrolase [Saprospiraceae bacterium]
MNNKEHMNLRGAYLTITFLLTIILSMQAQEKNKTDSLVFLKFNSNTLHEERKIVIHLPLNYYIEPSKKYPVMYVLDASKLDFDISDRLFTLSSADISPECIVVGILNNKGKRELDFTPPFMQTETNDSLSPMGKADDFFKFMKDELIPSIDSTYRTSGIQTISGHSRAGLFVLYTLIQQPDLFDARFCYSTPAWRFDNLIVQKLEKSFLKHKAAAQSFLYFSVGNKENENIQASFHHMNAVLEKSKPKSLVYSSDFVANADHQSNPIFSTGKALAQWSEYLKSAKK